MADDTDLAVAAFLETCTKAGVKVSTWRREVRLKRVNGGVPPQELLAQAEVLKAALLRHSRQQRQANISPEPGKHQDIPPGEPPPDNDPANGIATDVIAKHAVLVDLADVKAEDIEWLRGQRIARGKLHLWGGDPGIGKSYLALDTTGRTISGSEWPEGGRAPQGTVVWLSAEDALADTIKPRLQAMGFDPKPGQVIALTAIRDAEGDRMFVLDRDLPQLGETFAAHHPLIAFIDPPTAYLGDVDSHNDAEVRSILAPLAALAERYRVAIILLMHLNKDQLKRALYRIGGSIGFLAASRIAFAVVYDPDFEGPKQAGAPRLFFTIKMNLTTWPAALRFTIDDRGVQWEPGLVPVDDVEALFQGTSSEDTITQQELTEGWIRSILHDDVRTVLEAQGVDRLPTIPLLWHLVQFPDRPWKTMWEAQLADENQRPLAAKEFARLVKPIQPKTIRGPGISGTPKGYYARDFGVNPGPASGTGPDVVADDPMPQSQPQHRHSRHNPEETDQDATCGGCGDVAAPKVTEGKPPQRGGSQPAADGAIPASALLLLQRAQRYGYPSTTLSSGITIAAGKDAWEAFALEAPASEYNDAAARLQALPCIGQASRSFEEPPRPAKPTAPCRACHARRFWLPTSRSRWICDTCHPPMALSLVLERCEVPA
jgi:hypothetical protein